MRLTQFFSSLAFGLDAVFLMFLVARRLSHSCCCSHPLPPSRCAENFDSAGFGEYKTLFRFLETGSADPRFCRAGTQQRASGKTRC